MLQFSKPMGYKYWSGPRTEFRPKLRTSSFAFVNNAQGHKPLLVMFVGLMFVAKMNATSPASAAHELGGVASPPGVEKTADTSLPAGTRLFVRLDTGVSTQTSHLRSPVTAKIVREVAGADGTAIPLGSVVSGTLTKIIPSSSPTDRARLKIQFDQLVISSQSAISFTGHVAEVENAKESVLPDGTVQGVLASELAVSLIDKALGKLGTLGQDAQKKVGTPNTTIEFPAGTDLNIVLDKPLELHRVFSSVVTGELPSDVRNAIIKLLADAPQRASGKTGKPGDPLNLIFVGSQAEILNAFEQAGWEIPEQATGGSISRSTRAAIQDVGYGKAPVSDLYLYGKQEQLAFEKMFNTFAKRHHLRLWQTPIKTADGRGIWLAASTHDIGIDVHPGVVSHAIDPQIDLEREKVGADLMVSGAVAEEQLVTRPNPLSQGMTATGGTWSTDGQLRVIVLKPGS
jgi:hypothetical protein